MVRNLRQKADHEQAISRRLVVRRLRPSRGVSELPDALQDWGP